MNTKKVLPLAGFVLLLCVGPLAINLAAQEFGTIRALQQRAEHVIRQKNEFVARVLTSYDIRHALDQQGQVIRLFIKEEWLDIRAVEIVPLLQETSDLPGRVAGHELYFFTDEGILVLVSELLIR